jgi:DNA-binding PadR family transcriptional regulator
LGVDKSGAYVYNVDLSEVLGTFEQAVLVSLVQLGTDAYGRAVLKEVQRRLRREVSAGAVYATLDRLEGKGLVSSRLGAGTPARGGHPRRFYEITHAGVRALNKSKAAVEHVWAGFRWPLKGRA